MKVKVICQENWRERISIIRELTKSESTWSGIVEVAFRACLSNSLFPIFRSEILKWIMRSGADCKDNNYL